MRKNNIVGIEQYYKKLRDPQLRNVHGIYKIAIAGPKIVNLFYVGSAVNLPKRLREHITALKANRHDNLHLQRAFNKYAAWNLFGDVPIFFEILEFVEVKQNLIAREQFYINYLKPTYNICPIAGNTSGYQHSEESRKKMRGLKRSEETKRKISEARKGTRRFKHSEETKKKMSRSKDGFRNNRALQGTLENIRTGTYYSFDCLKSLAKSLDLGYRGLTSSAFLGNIYKKEWKVKYSEDIKVVLD
jgi:group I intron endonuclease